MKKRALASAILATTVAASALIGCAHSAPTASKVVDNLPANMKLTSTPAEKITLPISSSPITLSYFAMPEPYVISKMKGYSDMEAYQALEKATNVKINWDQESYTDPKAKMNLMFSTGEVEDIVWDADKYVSGGAKKLLNDGQIIALNKYIDKYAPNYKKLLQTVPGLLQQVSTDDGQIYEFPEIREDPVTRSNSGFVLRKDWLDKLGLKAPQTIDEWYTVLKAFKTKDPNGNGKNDEIPFISLGHNKTSQSIDNFAPGFGIVDGLYVKNGTVKFGPYDPEYKNYLETMSKWYKEGLIDPEFSTQDSKLFDSKMTNNLGGAFYGALSGNLGTYLSTMNGKNGYDLAATSMPKAPDGKVYVAVSAYGQLAPHGASIGKNNKHIIETVKWLDLKYSQEYHDLFSWGTEGKSYTVSSGKKTFTSLITKNPDGLSINEADAKYAGGTMVQMPIVDDSDVFLQLKSLPEQVQAANIWKTADTSMILPNLFFDNATTSENANISSEIQTYVDENFNKFVMGLKPMSDFDSFRAQLKSMGVEKLIANNQKAYDKAYKSK